MSFRNSQRFFWVLFFFLCLFLSACNGFNLLSSAHCDRLVGGQVNNNYKSTVAYRNEAGRCFSSRVTIEMEPRVPVVFRQGNEKVVCRKGLPRRYLTPWDIALVEQGRAEDANTEIREEGEENSSNNNDTVVESVEDYWFKVTPLIDNESNHYLIITDFNLRIVSSGRDRQTAEATFSDGYCETSPLYIFDNSGQPSGDPGDTSVRSTSLVHGSYTLPSDINKRFVMGNLIFYVGGLPNSEEGESSSRSPSFSPITIPRYTIHWQMLGTFYRLGSGNTGEHVANFQKKGSFSTQPSSF